MNLLPLNERNGSKGNSTPKSDRISTRERAGFAAGTLAGNISAAVTHVLINPVFNITMGVSPAVLSTVGFMQTMWYTMAVPAVGQFTDNFRSRWGRRRPLIGAMAIPLALSFVGLWFFPRYSSERYLLTYLVVASLIFYLADACYSVPMNALILEATGDYHERTRVNVFTQAIVFIASIAVQWAFPFTQLKIFSGTLDGVRCFAIIFGLLIASMALIPCFINREPLYNNIQLQPINSFSQSIKATIRNRPFIILIAIRSIYTFSYNIVGALGLYLNYYYVFGGDVKHAAIMQGWNGTIFQISAIASLLFYRNFAIRYGKGRAMACAGGILALGSIGKLFLYVPGRPWLQIFIYIANGAAGAGSVTMANAALADIADYGELATGARQEGAYIAVLGWFDRIGNSMGSLISGFFLVWVGFNAKLGGHQSLGTLRLMQFAYFFVPFLGAAVIVWLSIIYPLNESSCYRIKRALESRRMVGPSFLNLSG